MKFRVLLLTVILVLAVAVAASAQQGPAGPRPGQPVLGPRIIQQLGLSQDQVQQIRAIVEKYHQDVTAVLKGTGTKEEKGPQLKDLRTKAAAAINAVLTADQQAKAQKMRLIDILLAPRQARAELGFIALVWKLDLTADQKTTIKGILQPAEAAAKAIREDNTLKPRDKAQKLAQLRQDTNQKVLAVLTPDQQAKLKDMMKNAQQGQAK